MFSGAQRITISGGNFTVITGGRETQADGNGMAIFRNYISVGAMHDSAVRSDVPKCHEHTRVAIIERISQWERSLPDRPFLWMYGPAGCGKTTIAQTMAEKFDGSGRLAASFFFSRSATGRPTTKDGFVATIAFQLCLSLGGLRPYTLRALGDNPTVFDKTLSKQADILIINPLNLFMASQNVQPKTISAPRVILVDGLDECTPSESQKEILDVLARCQHDLSSFRFKFLISGRPERKLRTYFSPSSLGPVTLGLPLDNDYHISRDIKLFLISEFNKIRQNHPAGRDLPPNWPSEADISYLVTKSSGQFVYVSVAMKYIADVHRHPLQSLTDVMDISTSNAMPFADLDALYTICLSSIPLQNLEYVLDVFLWMMTTSRGHNYYNPNWSPCAKSTRWADRLLGGGILGTTETHLDGLHSIIYVPQNNDHELAFFHASFSDFLCDQSRSGSFCVNSSIRGPRLAYRMCESVYLNKLVIEDLLHMQQIDVLKIMFFHCRQGLITPKLQEKLYALDITSMLKHTDGIPERRWWRKVSIFLNSIIWMREQPFSVSLQSLDSHILENIRTAINTSSPQYSELMRHYTSIILTFPLKIYAFTNLLGVNVTLSFPALFADYALLDTPIDMLNHLLLTVVTSTSDSLFDDSDSVMLGDTILSDKSLQFLRDILNPRPMDDTGQYYADRSQYTNMARTMAKGLAIQLHTLFATPTIPLETYFLGISMFLTKCDPHPELGHYLLDNCLAISSKQLDNFDKNLHYMYNSFCTSCLIYVQECGIPFAEHKHPLVYETQNFFCSPCHVRSSDEL